MAVLGLYVWLQVRLNVWVWLYDCLHVWLWLLAVVELWLWLCRHPQRVTLVLPGKCSGEAGY